MALGIRRVLEKVTDTVIPRSSPLPKTLIESIRMGTTVATNGNDRTLMESGGILD